MTASTPLPQRQPQRQPHRQQQQARAAGCLYFLMALAAPFGLLVVPGEIIVPGDAQATADKLRSVGWMLRAGIASELVHQIIAVFLVLALYRLFRPVSQVLAQQLVVLGALLSVPIMFVNVLNHVAALMMAGPVVGADFLAALAPTQRDALAYFFLQLHGQGVTVASVFWGLWLLPFGLLVMRCGFIPRMLGVLLIAAGVGYLVGAFTALVLPQFGPVVSQVVAPLQFGELPIIFWLLIWGARGKVG